MSIPVRKLKGLNMELTPALSVYITKKLEALEKFVDPEDTSVGVDIEIGKTTAHHKLGVVFRAEFNMTYHGKLVRAVADAEDLYAAIDEVKDELARELRVRKEKQQTLFRRGGSAIKNLMRGFYREK